MLTGANTYSGGTTINAGVLSIAADNNLGAGTGGLAFGGGTLRLGARLRSGGTRAITLNAGGGTFDTNGFDTTVSQAISGTGALTKAGTGTLTLGGVNTYTGATIVDGGTLIVNGSIAASSVDDREQRRHAGRHRHARIDDDRERRHAGARQFDRHHHGQRQSRRSTPARTYAVEVSPSAADRTNVIGGTATLTGATVQAIALCPAASAAGPTPSSMPAAGSAARSSQGSTSSAASARRAIRI